MSPSMIGFHESGRYALSSVSTRGSPTGTDPDMISGPGSPIRTVSENAKTLKFDGQDFVAE